MPYANIYSFASSPEDIHTAHKNDTLSLISEVAEFQWVYFVKLN